MPSDLVMERFRLVERIGSGGMGVVYRAFDERLQREVAVKAIAAADPERVLREAQAAARLNHPGIVTVYELGRRGSRALLVSELVPGATLAELRAANSLSDRDVAELGADLCDALSHAHARGVVHRDVKPQNIVVRDDDHAGRRAKLMDFGIARLTGAPSLTASGEVVGTLAYMAPEQAEGLAVGPAADTYSLALTLYECWTGLNPVVGENPAATARRIGEPVPSLGEARPDLPAPLAAAVDACLLAEASMRPAPRRLREQLDDAIPALDSVRAVPAPTDTAVAERPARRRSFAPLFSLVALAGALVLLTGPGNVPGAALVVAVLACPAILVLPGIRPGIPLVGLVLGAVGAAAAYPAAAALAGDRTAQRALAGALGWCWALIAASGLGAGSGFGIVTPAPDGWASSASVAASGVLAPLFEPAALLGAAAFALAAATLGWVLAAGHISLAALGALVWAAGFVAVGGIVADGSLGEAPFLVALAAATTVAVEHGRRVRDQRSHARGRPDAGLEVDRSRPGSPAAHAGIRAVS
jgi:eukaryotic-like serine/threonine-protein kinase